MSQQPVVVRFPPSPTGYCHVGTARMAILNYLFAKHHNGKIIFRSEDTDKARSKKEFEDNILDSLTWLGLSWDEFYRQSDRLSIHQEHLKRLIAEGKAYESTEESKMNPGTQTTVVRLKNPGTVVTFNDVIRGAITFDTTELGDFVIARSINDPLYHFVVVVDDATMGVTHVIRGEDHISNTPRQILIQEALGFARPVYAHYSLNLSADRAKLSKRTGDVAVQIYRDKGFLPEALRNYLAVIGWTPPSQKEILTLPEMIDQFHLADIHPSGVVFDMEKLRWYNRQYLLALRSDDFASEYLRWIEKAITSIPGATWNENRAHALLPIVKDRIHVWGDIPEMVSLGEWVYFFSQPVLKKELIPNRKSTPEVAAEHLQEILKTLSSLPESDFTIERLNASLMSYATEKGRGDVLWPLRYSLTGAEKSPDPFTCAAMLGKNEVLARLENAITLLTA